MLPHFGNIKWRQVAANSKKHLEAIETIATSEISCKHLQASAFIAVNNIIETKIMKGMLSITEMSS